MTRIGERAWSTGPFSPLFHGAAELVGRRWNGAILYALAHGIVRFNELKDAIPGLSARMLAERLRELEDNGIVSRTVTADRPPGVQYQLTPKGDALRPVLRALNAWAFEWTRRG